MTCPGCKGSLKTIVSKDVEVDICSSCKGHWVSRLKEKDLMKMKPETFTLDELKLLRKTYKPLGKEDPVRYVPCPLCSQMMNRVQWGAYSFVVVDRCEDHGTWYGEGELEKIEEFISKGGAEMEKYATLDDSRQKLSSRLSRVANRLDQRIDNTNLYIRFGLYGLAGF